MSSITRRPGKNSAEYKKASEFRNKVATSNIALVEQFTWPPAVGG